MSEQDFIDAVTAVLADQKNEVALERVIMMVEREPALRTELQRQLTMHRLLTASQSSSVDSDCIMARIYTCAQAEQVMPLALSGDSSALSTLTTLCERESVLAKQVYEQLAVNRLIKAAASSPINTELVINALPVQRDTSLGSCVLKTIATRDRSRRRRSRPSRMSKLAAAAVLLVGLVIGLGYVFEEELAKIFNKPRTLNAIDVNASAIAGARMRVSADVKWIDNLAPYDKNGHVIYQHINLDAGEAELVLASGVTLLLQGNTQVELIDRNEVRLVRGRLTSYVPPGAAGFTLRANHVDVIDLGTAFGIFQDDDGHAAVHVFSGQVEAIATRADSDKRVRMERGHALRIKANHDEWESIPCDPTQFVFTLDRQPMIMDVADVIAGGDGSGNGTADGIDPSTGKLVTTPARGLINSDGKYHPVPESKAVDGIFIPKGNEETTLTSTGFSYKFPVRMNRCYDILRRGGTWDTRGNGGTPGRPGIPPVFGGIDYRNPGHSAIGMHASMGFTIDLQQVCERNSSLFTKKFTATIANTGYKQRHTSKADVWFFIDGNLIKQIRGLTPQLPPVEIKIDIPETARFLTIVSTDGDQEEEQVDWITLGDPRLHTDFRKAPISPLGR